MEKAKAKTKPKTKAAKTARAKTKKSSSNGTPRKRGRPAKQTADGLTDADRLEVRLDTVVGLEWKALDNELRNHLQGIRIADLEIERAQRAFQDQVQKLNAHKLQLKAEYERQHKECREIIERIALENDLDPAKIAIDTDTFIVRDLRQE